MPEPSPEGRAALLWAKSDRGTDAWLPLWRHMADSAEVAKLLWNDWLADGIRRRLTADVRDPAQARRRFVWLAAVHDLGKATAAFQMQVPPLCLPLRSEGFDFAVLADERRRLPHSLASMHLLQRWLVERQGWNVRTARSYAVVPGSHHGVTPTHQDLSGVSHRPELLGLAPAWKEAQDCLADHAAALAQVTRDDLAAWSSRPLGLDAQILLTAGVVVADWLASDSTRFRYDDGRASAERAAEAWHDIALPPAWHPLPTPDDPSALYAERFSLPENARPRPVQLAAVELAREVDVPGLMIIEAPMGEGKTEAALAVAEVFAERSGAGGCFVALPTMATSDAMFSRVRSWVGRLPNDGPAQSIFLAHSKAWFNEEFSSLDREIRPHAVGDDAYDQSRDRRMPPEVVIAHQWLSGRKKGPLSNFVVGTIDQVLFAALKARHLMLRHLALVGKVVVIDEVHAVDVFMSTYLERVLHWLGAYGTPTVLLSATLPAAQRRALLDAYRNGATAAGRLRQPESRVPVGEETDALGGLAALLVAEATTEAKPEVSSPGEPIGYPLITVTTSGEPIVRAVPSSARSSKVSLQRLSDDDDSLFTLLRERLEGGGCAVVIRNTVSRAQQTMRLLEQELGEDTELRLMHARFAAAHRAENDEWLRTRFGPAELLERLGSARPGKAVIVATQVVEQSLDIDFDLMVTDLAPTDLLLQRIGRLHRHPRSSRPAAVADPYCFVTGIEDWSAVPPGLEKGSSLVYGDYTLLRSLIAIEEHLDGRPIRLPEDIPRLVEATFGVEEGTPGVWSDAMATARRAWAQMRGEKERRASTFLLKDIEEQNGSLLGWLDRGAGEANEEGARAQVRDSEDALEVLLVQGDAEGIRTLDNLPDGGGLTLATEFEPERRAAIAAAKSSVRLPQSLSAPWAIDSTIRELERNAYPGWQQSPWLAGQLVVVLDQELRGRIGHHELHYSRERGLEVTDVSRSRKDDSHVT